MKLGGSKAGRVEISPTIGKTRTLTHLKPKCHHDIESRDKVKRKHVSSGQSVLQPRSKTTSPAFPIEFKKLDCFSCNENSTLVFPVGLNVQDRKTGVTAVSLRNPR